MLRLKWNIVCPQDCDCKDQDLWKQHLEIDNLDQQIIQFAVQEKNSGKALQAAKKLLKLYDQVEI